LAGKDAAPNLVNIDLRPYQTVHACERVDILNIGGLSDSVFNVTSVFLADNNHRLVTEVEAIELQMRVGLKSTCGILETTPTGRISG
jgi:hypothetical protein